MPEDISVRPGRQPWAGKVHNPGKLFDAEQAERRSQRNGEFAKSQKDAILKRFTEIEGGISTLAKAIKERFESLEQKIAELTVAASTKKKTKADDVDAEA